MAYSESINRLRTVRERIMRARVCGIYEKRAERNWMSKSSVKEGS